MYRLRASWIIIVVVLITAAVPPLRDQAKLVLTVPSMGGLSELFVPTGTEIPAESIPDPIAAYRGRAAAFVREHCPNDPEMLLAAGLLTPDKKAGRELIRRAAEKGTAPAAWTAYCTALIEQLPEWDRLGESAVDPTRPDLVAEEMKRLQDRKLPDRLDPKAAAQVMKALASWEKADPQNGLPIALEVRLLYGMHEDRKALDRWEAASARPQVEDYWSESGRAVAKLLTRLGIPEPEAALHGSTWGDLGTTLYASLRQGARVAQYEGELAQMQGRSADAIRWWNSSIALGRNLQNTSDTLIGHLVGTAIESIGASPTWKWYMDQSTGTPGGPLRGGRLWYGRDHAFYVSQVGEQKDAEVRDSLVGGKLRSQLLHEDFAKAMDRFLSGPEMRGVMLVMLGAGAAVFAALCLLLFLAFGTWGRAAADGATRLRPVCQSLLALAPFAPLAVAAVLATRAGTRTQVDRATATNLPEITALLSLVLAVLAVILLPLIAAPFTRTSGARLSAAWRGNLRHSLPATAALAMLCFLALNLAALKPRAEWVRQWSDPNMTEMAQARQRFGARWEKPEIPQDAWRAGYPKLVER